MFRAPCRRFDLKGRQRVQRTLPEQPRPLTDLKVALFTGNYNYLKEGANQALNRLARHLEERVGAEVRAYSPVTATPAFEPEGTLVAVPSVPLPGRSEFRLALRLPGPIRDDLRAFSPDIVHVATPDILCTRAQTFSHRLGIPVVASVHTRFESYIDYYGLGVVRALVERHLDRFYRRSDLILAPTPAIAAQMGSKHGAEKVQLWSRGVDADLFHPQRRSDGWRRAHGVGDDEIALLFFGRLVLEKGIDRYAEVVNAVRRRGVTVRPIIVGAGPARRRLEASLPDATFAGHLTGIALATAIASTDVLINPSVTEAFGNVVLEAMASGLAVVAADVPSVTNLAQDGISVLLCAPDTQAYVQRVAQLIAEPELRSGLGRAARAAAARWRWDQVLDTVLESYASLLDRRRFDAGQDGA